MSKPPWGSGWPAPLRRQGLAAWQTLRERWHSDHLSLTASSLTFTTLIAVVPLVTLMLALFSAFPMFRDMQDSLQRYLIQGLVPEAIARPVLQAVTQFAGKANRLGSLGLVLFLGTAMALMLTIDRTLNAIWRVHEPRPLAQRVLVYWAAVTLGPVVLGASLWLTATALGWTRSGLDDWPEALAAIISVLLAVAEFALLAVAFAALYRHVPNTPVRWTHALVGGVLAAAGFLLVKKALAVYLKAVPTFSVVYGTFATVPIFLLWIYLAWLVVLFGAVLAAYAPAMLAGLRLRPAKPGLAAELALEILALLAQARAVDGRGATKDELAGAMRTDPLQIDPVLHELMAMDWVGRLDEAGHPRHVLLVEPADTPVAALVDRLVLAPSVSAEGLRQLLRARQLMLREALPPVSAQRLQALSANG